MAIRFESNGTAQFENVNELRSYPFVDDADLATADGDTLPDGILADLHIVVPTGDGRVEDDGDDTVAKVVSVHLSSSMVSVCVAVYRAGAQFAALSAMVSMDSFAPYTPYRMVKLHGVEDCGGVVTFGDFDLPARPTTYRLRNARICDGCVARFDPPQLRSIVDQRSGKSVRGDVKIEFSGHIDTKKTGDRSVSLSLKEGSAEELMSSCAKQLSINPCGATPIMSINGVRPDSQGRIVLWFH